MPRRTDHDQRRRQIAEAVWRLAARAGLEDVTLRQVAAEAGVSVRLVQYYFGSRVRLLLDTLALLNADGERSAGERVAAVDPSHGLRGVVRAVLKELLPLDAERRQRLLVQVAYFIPMLSDDDLGAAVRDAPPTVEQLVAGLIAAAVAAGEASHVDPELEAWMLVATAQGLQGSMLLGQVTEVAAVAVIDHQLDRIFAAGRDLTDGRQPGIETT